MSEDENERLRATFRDRMTRTPYIGGLRITVEEWSPEGARLRLPFAPELTNDGQAFHGGVIALLVDTAGSEIRVSDTDGRGIATATLVYRIVP